MFTYRYQSVSRDGLAATKDGGFPGGSLAFFLFSALSPTNSTQKEPQRKRNLKKSHNHDMNGSEESGGDFTTSFPNCVSSARPIKSTKSKEDCLSGRFFWCRRNVYANVFILLLEEQFRRLSPTSCVVLRLRLAAVAK